ncbi:hypothetical protein WM40_01655 [Robbsia andropogonis]|uniref:Uncharacterized protein n=1 Tax=Robbsia andropogonis TaxID=28092 RepID=A0A0F5K626_9BURK|nr:hypothetical protein WM40_01655 [Robbsia andropogonis]
MACPRALPGRDWQPYARTAIERIAWADVALLHWRSRARQAWNRADGMQAGTALARMGLCRICNAVEN